MPYNGTGTYNPIPSPDFPAVPQTTIRSSQYNNQVLDIASALSLSLTRDGQSTVTGDIPFGNHGILDLRAAVARAEPPNAGQIQDGSLHLLTGIAGANDITALAPLDLTAYTLGQRVVFIPVAANTGNVTLKIGALAAKPVTMDGTTQIAVGALKAGIVYEAWYDGAGWQLGGLASMLLGVQATIQAQIDALKGELPYLGVPVGTTFILDNGAPPPPTDSPDYRFVSLVAGLTGAGGYNQGALTSEAVTGSDPTVTATAVVSVAGPMNGKTIELIGTSRAFPRPAPSQGTIVNSLNKSHTHGVTAVDISSGSNGIISYGGGVNYHTNLTTGGGSQDGAEGYPRHTYRVYYMRVK